MMDHSNAPVWAIPNFELGEILPVLLGNSKHSIYIFKRLDPGQRVPIGAVWSGSALCEKYNMGSLQRAIRVKSSYLKWFI